MRRRALIAAALLPPMAAAAQETAPRNRASEFWFDPTQLPAFTGTVERYLINPRGETDALLFREGAQIVFPPEFGQAVREAAPPGRPIVVWGIRARQAPVITMLAFAPSADVAPVVVERVYWRLLGRDAAERAEPLEAQGTVRAPYYTPQGEVAGAVLEDGTVITVPPGRAEALRERLQPGAKLAAVGRGVAGEQGRALAAERIGADPDSLQPIPAAEPNTSPTPPRSRATQ